jgi:hypothetical protein
MPITFPPSNRLDDWRHHEQLGVTPAIQIEANPNWSNVAEFSANDLAPGTPIDFETGRHNNVGRSLGYTYEDVGQAARLNQIVSPRRQALVAEFSILQTGTSSFTMSGIAYDSTGTTPQASAVIDLFLTGSDTLVQSTVTDSAGAFWFSLMAPGPYYIVGYKPGSPDIAGTTVNTLNPA